jgi:hypothetical protein
LYDLKHDVRESVSVASAHPDIVKRLKEAMDHAIAAGFTRPGAVADKTTDVSSN